MLFPGSAGIVARVQSLPHVAVVLDVVAALTRMKFSAVAVDADDHWLACAVHDQLDLGLQPGQVLTAARELCDDTRLSRQAVAVADTTHPPAHIHHATVHTYGFQSYASAPITMADGTFFGTLIAADPAPGTFDPELITKVFTLLAELIGYQLARAMALPAPRT